MNYHILIDHWIVDDFITTAEGVDAGNNTFLITSDKPWKHIKSKLALPAPYNSTILDGIFASIKKNDRVYVHWFDDGVVQYTNRLPKEVELYLIFWGGDFLSVTQAFVNANHDTQTKKYLRDPNQKKPNVILALRQYRARILNQRRSYRIRNQFMTRLNYFCHWNYRDMEIVKSAFGGHPKFLPFYYGGGLDQIPGPNFKPRGKVLHVWLGNSDSSSNNHLDAMQMLLRFREEDMQITCPLSYGFGHYGALVAGKGEEMFGDKWKALRQLLPLRDYIALQYEADVAVMNHNRSQASGNIIAFIRMGKKVYLKKESTIFALLIEKGIKVFDVKDLERISFEEFREPLTEAEATRNSELIEDLFSSGEGKTRGFKRILKKEFQE